jgi:hypothetical protein
MSDWQIDKIYFMVHPLAYAGPVEELLRGRNIPEREQILWFWQREREVRPRQDELIRNLKQNEALVLYPIGQSEAMRQLEVFVRQTLGRRCVVLPERIPGPRNPEEWATADPIVKAQIADEIVRMYDVYWYDWQAPEVKVIVFSRWYADAIERGFRDAGLTFDPATVEVEAFGESFDGCVTTWTNMTASFLGLANPVEKNYDLSVPDLGFLRTARFVERRTLGHHFSLYLWEEKGGTPIGLFAKGSYRSDEPRYVAVFPVHGWRVTVRTRIDWEVWPGRRGDTRSVRVDEGTMRVAVHTGSRRGVPKGDPAADMALCIFGHGVEMADFRERLAGAEITVEEPDR